MNKVKTMCYMIDLFTLSIKKMNKFVKIIAWVTPLTCSICSQGYYSYTVDVNRVLISNLPWFYKVLFIFWLLASLEPCP